MINNIQILGTCRIYDALKIAAENSEINLLPRFWGFSHSTPEIIQNIGLALQEDINTEEQDIECLNFADFKHPRFRNPVEMSTTISAASIIFVEISSLKTYYFKNKYTQANRLAEYFNLSVKDIDVALDAGLLPAILPEKSDDWKSIRFQRQSIDELEEDIKQIIKILAPHKIVLINHFIVNDENAARFHTRLQIRNCLDEISKSYPSRIYRYDPTLKLCEYGYPIIDYAHYQSSFIHLLSLELTNLIRSIVTQHSNETIASDLEKITTPDEIYLKLNTIDYSTVVEELTPSLIVERAISRVMDEDLSRKSNTVFFSIPEQPLSIATSDNFLLDPMCTSLSPDFSKPYPVPPVHSYIIEKGFVQGKTFFCCSVDHPDSSSTRLYMANEDHLKKYSQSTEILQLEEDTVYIISGNMGCKVFYHWFYQCLPAMLHARSILNAQNVKYKFVVPPLCTWQLESMKIAGVLQSDCILLTDEQSILGARIFYTSLLSGKYCFAPSNLIFETMREYHKKCLSNLPSEKRTKNLYITRRDTPKRKITNEDELCAELSKLDFDIITLSDYSLEEQAELFTFADFIIAPHGSGLVNLMFCTQKTHLIEIMPENYLNSCFFRIAKHLNMSYEQTISKTDKKIGRHTSSSIVDVEKIVKMVQTRFAFDEAKLDLKATA